MSRLPTAHWFRKAALGLAGGGLGWLGKAGSILATGWQPPQLLELGQALCALGLLGLYAGLDHRKGVLARAGGLAAGLALAAQAAATAYEFVPGAVISTGEEFVFPYSLLVLIGAAGTLLGMLLLGAACYRASGLPRPERAGPLAAGLAPLPAALTGAIHIEWPILLIGGAWVAAGWALWRSAATFHRSESAT